MIIKTNSYADFKQFLTTNPGIVVYYDASPSFFRAWGSAEGPFGIWELVELTLASKPSSFGTDFPSAGQLNAPLDVKSGLITFNDYSDFKNFGYTWGTGGAIYYFDDSSSSYFDVWGYAGWQGSLSHAFNFLARLRLTSRPSSFSTDWPSAVQLNEPMAFHNEGSLES